MGNPIFGVDIAGLIAEHIGEAVFEVTIVRDVRGEREPGNLTGGRQPVAPVESECMGFIEDFTGPQPPGLTIETGDRKVTLIGDTIPAGSLPRFNDAITIHEPIGDTTVFFKAFVSRDPAAAVYVCQCGDRRGPDGK